MNYEELSKDELIQILMDNEELSGKYGLVWDKEKEPEKIVVDCDKKIPILVEDKNKFIDKNEDITNILIEGDNFHSLSVLNYTHKESVDVIYIDPPYNTGNKDFNYNDSYVDPEDGYRHSKWLNFMSKRLKLAKNLLKENGLIFISIDDNEYAQLKLLCDKIFNSNNFVNNIVVKMSEASGIKMAHVGSRLPKLKEYVLVYKKNTISLNNIRVQKEEWDDEYKTVITDISKDDLNYVKKIMEKDDRTEEEIDICRKILDSANYCSLSNIYKENNIVSADEKIKFNCDNSYRIFQTVSMGSGTTEAIKESKNKYLKNKFFIHITAKNKMYVIKGDFDNNVRKPRLQVLFADQYLTYNPCDLWTDIKTTGLDNEGFVDFKNGKKPLKLIKRILELSNNKGAIVLDFFAGSGTTGQAVLELNEEDDGNRKFILCTNNENGICENITYERLKKTILGDKNYSPKNSNLKYYKCDFVENSNNRDQLYFDLTERCIPMLCVKDNNYIEYKSTDEYVIYSNKEENRFSCVYYSLFGNKEEEFINLLENLEGSKSIYKFALGDDLDLSQFKNVKDYSIEPIPYKIVELYKRIVKLSREED